MSTAPVAIRTPSSQDAWHAKSDLPGWTACGSYVPPNYERTPITSITSTDPLCLQCWGGRL